MHRSSQAAYQHRAGEAHRVTVYHYNPSLARAETRVDVEPKAASTRTPTPAPTYPHHLHSTPISLHHLRHSTTSCIINHHLRHITNSSNHLHHPPPQLSTTYSPTICNSRHGPQTIEPHLHLNTMETLPPPPANFSYATKLP
jgi:hypothetical protein